MSSVAEILSQLAENAGQAQLRKGAIYGNLVSGVSQLPAVISADKQQQAATALHTTQVQQQIDLERARAAREDEAAKHQTDADTRAQQHQSAVNAAFSAGIAAHGNPTGPFDAVAAFKAANDAGDPSAVRDAIAQHRAGVQPIILNKDAIGVSPDTLTPIPGMNNVVPPKQTPEERQIFLVSKSKSTKLTPAEQAEVDAYNDVKAPKTERSLSQQLLDAIKNGDTEGANTITESMKKEAAAKGDPAAIAAANRQAATVAAQIAQQGRAQSFAEAQAGRGELTNKIEQPYLDAREKADTLRNVVALAKSGNKEAANVQALLGTLGLVTSEGVKRINTTELQQVAGAGSLFDKVKAKAGSWTAGQPMPAGLQDDLVQLGAMLEQSARKKYEQGFIQTKTRYGLKDEVMMPPSNAPDKGTIGSVGGKPAVWDYRNDQWGWWPQ